MNLLIINPVIRPNENYYKFISRDQIEQKIRDLFGPLINKTNFDDKDLENRMKYGRIGMF